MPWAWAMPHMIAGVTAAPRWTCSSVRGVWGSSLGRGMAAPRGAAYCPTDALQFPPTARFCPICEGDLMVDCANCGTTIRAADDSCYHCGTREIFARVSADD